MKHNFYSRDVQVNSLKKKQPKTGILVFLLTLKNDSLQKLAPMNFYDSTYSQNFIFKSLSQFKHLQL